MVRVGCWNTYFTRFKFGLFVHKKKSNELITFAKSSHISKKTGSQIPASDYIGSEYRIILDPYSLCVAAFWKQYVRSMGLRFLQDGFQMAPTWSQTTWRRFQVVRDETEMVRILPMKSEDGRRWSVVAQAKTLNRVKIVIWTYKTSLVRRTGLRPLQDDFQMSPTWSQTIWRRFQLVRDETEMWAEYETIHKQVFLL